MNRVMDEAYSMSYLFENVDSFEVNEDTNELTVHLKQANPLPGNMYQPHLLARLSVKQL